MDANTAAPSVRQQCSVNTVCLAESSMTVNESFASFVLFVAHMKIRSAPHSVMVYFQHRSRRAKHQWRKEKTVCSSTRQLVECTKSKWNARKESFVTPVSAKRRDMMTADTEAEKVLWWDKTCRAKWNNRKHGCKQVMTTRIYMLCLKKVLHLYSFDITGRNHASRGWTLLFLLCDAHFTSALPSAASVGVGNRTWAFSLREKVMTLEQKANWCCGSVAFVSISVSRKTVINQNSSLQRGWP